VGMGADVQTLIARYPHGNIPIPLEQRNCFGTTSAKVKQWCARGTALLFMGAAAAARPLLPFVTRFIVNGLSIELLMYAQGKGTYDDKYDDPAQLIKFHEESRNMRYEALINKHGSIEVLTKQHLMTIRGVQYAISIISADDLALKAFPGTFNEIVSLWSVWSLLGGNSPMTWSVLKAKFDQIPQRHDPVALCKLHNDKLRALACHSIVTIEEVIEIRKAYESYRSEQKRLNQLENNSHAQKPLLQPKQKQD